MEVPMPRLLTDSDINIRGFLAHVLGGEEVRAGVFTYRDVYLEGLRSDLYDAGFKEDDALPEYVLSL
ncbi:hypothetical protein [Rhizobium sp. BK176]|uniref:hypothetical protein n=1 Tax=Rhizobium sp. BK176 TaxID=2587071 RepID=UPI0021693C0E|nr:hypothetical protein [Rhizobium sp. BK176]